jgi:multidrug efflux pump subunit AcrA (membrane-fusion protein)
VKRAATGVRLRVVATPQDEDAQPEEGALTFWDNVVDPATDTIKLKATMLNWDRKLWPGQFVRVKLRLQTLHDATVVPQQALQTGQDGQFVFVVQDDMTVGAAPGRGGAARWRRRRRSRRGAARRDGGDRRTVAARAGHAACSWPMPTGWCPPDVKARGGRGGRGGRRGGGAPQGGA